MPDRGNSKFKPQIKYSVSNRVIVGLGLIIVFFSGLMAYSLILYQRSVHEMNLINRTYVPLALGTSEIQSTQVIFNTLMDRLQDEPNHPLTRDWLNAARKYRPERLSRLIGIIEQSFGEPDALPRDELLFLRELRKRMRDVRRRYRLNENKFIRLFSTLDMGNASDTMEKTENLKRSERLLNKVLQAIGNDVRVHITALSNEAVDNGNMATIVLSVLGAFALLLAITIVFSTQRLLAPLKHLQVAVSKVAAGDFSTRTNIERNDEIGALASNFNRMTNALEERDKKLIRQERLATAGRIAAQVTHEIRNPLSSLDLNADLLKDEIGQEGSKEEAFQLLGAMQDEIERLTRITEAYLRFARLPAPSMAIGQLHSVIQNTIEFMTSQLNEASIEIEYQFDANPDTAFFDKEQIIQVVMNLIRNAIQAMPTGGRITVSTNNNEENLIVRFQDTGSGIPSNSIANIFDPFFTTKTDGTGLGLAMVRQIILAHEGNIQYIDSEKYGATFKLTLPKQKKEKENI